VTAKRDEKGSGGKGEQIAVAPKLGEKGASKRRGLFPECPGAPAPYPGKELLPRGKLENRAMPKEPMEEWES